MSLWAKIKGTVETIFQLGLGGPNLKANGTAVEARNSGDTGYAIMRGATPVGVNDLTTKLYVDTINKPIVAAQQFNGNSALPTNSGTSQFYVVTTTGPNASIGQLLFDDGSGSGAIVVLAALTGRTIFTAAAFTGGTISLAANDFYVWDGSQYLREADPAAFGATREIRYTINNTATQDSVASVPANAYVVSAEVSVTTPYSPGASISVGKSGSTTLLQLTTDNLPQAVGIYQVAQDTSWGGSALPVRTTITGSPAAGAGVVIVRYTVPDA